MRNFLGAIAPLICAAVAGVDALSAEEWQKQTIYQVVTDRFARTPSDDSGLGIIEAPDSDVDCPLPKQYCGGTWQGITDKLDYIQGMGFTAIWISPVIENTENASSDYSYHGYWPRNFYALNPHFGTEEDLIGLSDALHARGMYLMFDIVINHVFSPGPGNATDYSMFTPFNSSRFFHRPCVMDNSNETSVEVCQLRDDKATAVFTLPDVKTEDPEVRDIFQEWIRDTVQKYSVDGLRLDTYKHVERDFWPDFIGAAGVFSVAEYLNGDPASYDSELVPSKDEGVLNYPTFYWIRRIFQNPQTWMTELVQGIKTMRNGPLDTNLLAPFFENHDEQRFASLVGDIALTKNALAFTLLFDGIPIIYQGQEQHFSGQNDPFNRERLWTSGYDQDAELYRWISQLNAARALAIDTDPSFVSSQADTVWPPQAPAAGNSTGGGNSTIEGFISHELTEQGWFSTDEDNAQVAADITRLLVVVDYCTDPGQLFHVMFSESQTQTDFARDVSIKFLSLDPAPEDPALRSFVRRIFTFYLETSWSHEEEDWKEYLKSNGITPLDPSLRVDCPASNDSSLKPDQPKNEPAEIENKPVIPAKSNAEGILGRFFEFPGEIRDMIYREVLIAPEGTIVRGFSRPPLLRASRRLRDEALPLFYKHNHFEVTARWSRGDLLLAGKHRKLPGVEMGAWRRFLDMWNVFNDRGSDVLQYVERVTVIYQFSTDNGRPFGSREHEDRRLGFRLSRTPIEEAVYDIAIYDAQYEGDDKDEERHAVALNRGEFDWPSREETERLLFEKMKQHDAVRLWEAWPLGRLANMLWRCARDCPRATENVNFLFENFTNWLDNGGWAIYDPDEDPDEEEGFYDPDAEDDKRQQRP